MNVAITGSSSGIGKFLADALAAKGHAVCGLARSLQSHSITIPTPSPRPSGERVGVRGFDLETNAPPHPGPLLHCMEDREKANIAVCCDVSKWSDVELAANQIAQKWKSVDALICCAGIQEPIGPAMEIDPAAWRNALAVNLDGTFFSIRAFYSLLK